MNWKGWLTLLACLLLVGLIRAAVPTDLPAEYNVRPDDQGIVRIEEVSVQLVDVHTASAIRSVSEFSEKTFTAAPGTVLVVSRFRLAAHGGPFSARSQIRTADGFTYSALSLSGFPSPAVVHVGFPLTTTYIFEIPVDKLSGVIGIHGTRLDGLQPIAPLISYRLPEDLNRSPGEVVVPDDVVEPEQ